MQFNKIYNQDKQTIQMREQDGIPMDRWLEMPNWESIARLRRLVQRRRPELKPSDRVVLRRQINEQTSEGYYAGAKNE